MTVGMRPTDGKTTNGKGNPTEKIFHFRGISYSVGVSSVARRTSLFRSKGPFSGVTLNWCRALLMTTLESEKPIADEIVEHYNSYDESKRLTGGFGLLERERTKELIERYLPPSPATIIDVGGAGGMYSFWLASLGHAAHLVDIVPKHIEQARQASSEPDSHQLAGMVVGDARDLNFPSTFADVIIMHGPLYHLPDRKDRLQALTEAKRILRPGGA